MAKPRQRPIPVTRRERERLDAQKERYEKATGDTGDWGKFLGTVALAGLAALGVYKLVQSLNRSPQSVSVNCECGENFLMATPEGVGRLVLTNCPICRLELVVDLGPSREEAN